MGENTSIEWCDHTFNPWIGCSRVSPACDHCYAATSTPARTMGIVWDGPRHRTSLATWRQPLSWNRQAAAAGTRPRVFCASLADVFDNQVDPQWRADLFGLIRQTPNLDWLLLTKRIGNAVRLIEELQEPQTNWWPLSNVWLGATVANQEEADRDIPKLLATPARVRFLSMEPMLGRIDLEHVRAQLATNSYETGSCLHGNDGFGLSAPRNRIDWVIAGGESGPKARRFDVTWARDIVKQCKSADVPAFVKQLGARPTWDGCAGPDEHWPVPTEHVDNGNGYWEMQLRDRKGGNWDEWPADLRVREFPQREHE